MTGSTQHQNLDEEFIIMPWIGRTAKLMYIYMNQKFRQYNIPLTPKQWVLLKHLIEEDGQEQKNLALITERDKTSLTRLVSSMEKKGLVSRKEHPVDKRCNCIHITDKGVEAFNAAIPLAREARAAIEEPFDREELMIALGTIRSLHDHLKELTSLNADAQCDR